MKLFRAWIRWMITLFEFLKSPFGEWGKIRYGGDL
jgi:hypothetical protein